MTDHPLTEAAAAELWNAHRTHNALPFHEQGRLYMQDQTAMLRAAFDAGREHERTTPEDDRPWEPLNGGPVHVGDEVRQDFRGVTHTAVVARVDRSGDPWTAEGAIIGLLCHGTWHVRRAVQELPAEPGTVIIPAEGHEYVEAAFIGGTYYAREAMLADGLWRAIWRTADGVRVRYSVLPEDITPGPWKVDGK